MKLYMNIIVKKDSFQFPFILNKLIFFFKNRVQSTLSFFPSFSNMSICADTIDKMTIMDTFNILFVS